MTCSSFFLRLEDRLYGAFRCSSGADLDKFASKKTDHMVQEPVPAIIKNDRVCIRTGDVDLCYGADSALFHFQPAETGEVVSADKGTGGTDHGVCIEILAVLPEKAAVYNVRVRSDTDAVSVPFGTGEIAGVKTVRSTDDLRNGNIIRQVVVERFQKHGVLAQDQSGAPAA